MTKNLDPYPLLAHVTGSQAGLRGLSAPCSAVQRSSASPEQAGSGTGAIRLCQHGTSAQRLGHDRSILLPRLELVYLAVCHCHRAQRQLGDCEHGASLGCGLLEAKMVLTGLMIQYFLGLVIFAA